jgi:hypothetical protein
MLIFTVTGAKQADTRRPECVTEHFTKAKFECQAIFENGTTEIN